MKASDSHFLFFGRGRRRLCRALRRFALRRINLNQRKSEVNDCIIIFLRIYLSVEQKICKKSLKLYFRSKVTNISSKFRFGKEIYKMSSIYRICLEVCCMDSSLSIKLIKFDCQMFISSSTIWYGFFSSQFKLIGARCLQKGV